MLILRLWFLLKSTVSRQVGFCSLAVPLPFFAMRPDCSGVTLVLLGFLKVDCVLCWYFVGVVYGFQHIVRDRRLWIQLIDVHDLEYVFIGLLGNQLPYSDGIRVLPVLHVLVMRKEMVVAGEALDGIVLGRQPVLDMPAWHLTDL